MPQQHLGKGLKIIASKLDQHVYVFGREEKIKQLLSIETFQRNSFQVRAKQSGRDTGKGFSFRPIR